MNLESIALGATLILLRSLIFGLIFIIFIIFGNGAYSGIFVLQSLHNTRLIYILGTINMAQPSPLPPDPRYGIPALCFAPAGRGAEAPLDSRRVGRGF